MGILAVRGGPVWFKRAGPLLQSQQLRLPLQPVLLPVPLQVGGVPL